MKGNWFKIALLLIILVLGYMFALNGRYHVVDEHGLVIDKWTQKVIPWK